MNRPSRHAFVMLQHTAIRALRSALPATLVGALCGCASALFLWLLERVTAFREAHDWLVYALPIAGYAMGAAYERFGGGSPSSVNRVIDAVHGQPQMLPTRMAPMALVGTLWSHAFGASVGREGTAVQMGAAMADTLSRVARFEPWLRGHMLTAGVAGGFGAVFGTPLAGAVFGLEFCSVQGLRWRRLVPALVASFVGDAVTRAWGIKHTPFPAVHGLPMSPALCAKWLGLGLLAAFVGAAFVECTQWGRAVAERWVPALRWRMAIGGSLLVVLWQVVGLNDYLGLGVPLLERAFEDAHLPLSAFAWKWLFTVIALAAGFVGGEVTPLFVVGATLGSVYAARVGVPIAMGAGVGMAAVFACVSNTPLALALMAAELLGFQVLPHALLGCVVAYFGVGHRGIYSSQRLGRSKWGRKLQRVGALRDYSNLR